MSAPARFRRTADKSASDATNATAAAVLSLVASGAARTRVELARMLGVSASTITVKVAELADAGLLEDAGIGAPTGGRRARLLRVAPSGGRLLAASLGRRHVRVAVLDLSGALLQVEERALDVDHGPEPVLRQVLSAWHDVAGPIDPNTVHGVGLSVPSPVRPATGTPVAPASMAGWDGFGVTRWLQDRLGVRAVVDNDANLAALGEYTVRAARSDVATARTLLYVHAGRSLGGGLVLEGRLHRGTTWFGGDLAHVRVPAAGERRCACGNRGCLEVFAGGAGIVAQLRERGIEICGTAALAAASDDPEVATRLRASGGVLGETLAMLVNFVNPDLVAVGGALSSSEEYMAALRARLYAGCHPMATQSLVIEPSIAERDADLIGVGQLVLRRTITARENV